MRIFTRRLWLLALVLSGCLGFVQQALAVDVFGVSKVPFTVSRKTTRATEPRRPDGAVNYAAVLNAHFGEGVTAKNNACIAFYRALGPTHFDRDIAMHHWRWGPAQLDAFFDALEIDRPAEWKAGLFAVEEKPLGEKEAAMRQLREAASGDKFVSPLLSIREPEGHYTPLLGTIFPTNRAARLAVRALRDHGMHQLDEGEIDSAWKDLLAAYRLSRHLSSRATLQETIVGYFCERDSMRAILEFLRRAELDAVQLNKCRMDLAALPPHASVREVADFGERFIYLDAMTGTALQGLKHGCAGWTILASANESACKFGIESIDWDVALIAGNLWFDRLVRALETPEYASRRKRLDEIKAQLLAIRGPYADVRGEFSSIPPIGEPAYSELLGAQRTLKKQLAAQLTKREEEGVDGGKRRDAEFARTLANLCASTMLPQLIRAHGIENRLMQSHMNLEVAFALATFHKRHGHYPDALKDLPRDMLPPAKPSDLYTDEPLIYKRLGDGYSLSSAGCNETDRELRMMGDDMSDYLLNIQFKP